MQERSGSRQHVVAHHRDGRKARCARDGIREHETFSGHEMRGPAGTGRSGVSTAGGRQGQGAGEREGVRGRRGPSPPCFFLGYTYVFRLSVSMKKITSEYPFYIPIYMNSYLFTYLFHLFIFLSKTYSIFKFLYT